MAELEQIRWKNIVANMQVLQTASPASVERLLSSATFRRCAAGEVVFSANANVASLFFLVEGAIRIFQAQADLQYTPKILLPPSHFGELSSLAGEAHYRSSAATLTDSVIAELPVEVLEACMTTDHALCRAWLYSVARQFSVTIDYLRQNIFLGIPARLANALLTYADAFGRESDGWVEISFDLSYATLAQQCACTRRTAINVMKAFTETGLVGQTDKSWRIRPARLKEELLPGHLSLSYALDDNKEPAG